MLVVQKSSYRNPQTFFVTAIQQYSVKILVPNLSYSPPDLGLSHKFGLSI